MKGNIKHIIVCNIFDNRSIEVRDMEEASELTDCKIVDIINAIESGDDIKGWTFDYIET